jgi:hypothetical protein
MSQEVQLSPATSNAPIVTLPSPAPAGTSPKRPLPQPLTAPARQDSRLTVTPQKSGLSGHFHGSALPRIPGRHRARWNRSSRSRQVLGLPPCRPGLDPPRRGPASVRRARRSARRREYTACSRRTALPQPARPRPAGQTTDRHRHDVPPMYLASTSRGPALPPVRGSAAT